MSYGLGGSTGETMGVTGSGNGRGTGGVTGGGTGGGKMIVISMESVFRVDLATLRVLNDSRVSV